MIDYLIASKEWIFSGIGVAAISWIFFRNSANKKISMTQKSGDNSKNIQVGGDVKNFFRDDNRGN